MPLRLSYDTNQFICNNSDISLRRARCYTFIDSDFFNYAMYCSFDILLPMFFLSPHNERAIMLDSYYIKEQTIFINPVVISFLLTYLDNDP